MNRRTDNALDNRIAGTAVAIAVLCFMVSTCAPCPRLPINHPPIWPIAMTDNQYVMRDELRDELKRAAHDGVREALKEVGIDADDDWREVQKDMAHLRKSREGSEALTRWAKYAAVTTSVGACVSGAIYAFGQGVADAISAVIPK